MLTAGLEYAIDGRFYGRYRSYGGDHAVANDIDFHPFFCSLPHMVHQAEENRNDWLPMWILDSLRRGSGGRDDTIGDFVSEKLLPKLLEMRGSDGHLTFPTGGSIIENLLDEPRSIKSDEHFRWVFMDTRADSHEYKELLLAYRLFKDADA